MMDLSEYTRVVFNRIQKIEPKEVRKIIGYLLLQDHGDEQIVRLACGPEQSIREVIYKAKMELQIPASSPPISPSVPVLSPLSQRTSQPVSSSTYWEPLMNQNPDFSPSGLNDSFSEILNQTQFLSLDDQIEPYGLSFSNDSYCSLSSGRRFADMSVKTCHFFNKGFCRHGNSCKFFHGHSNSENFSQIYGYSEDHMFLPGSLEKLEIEIVDLLKSRKGNPISIASLPMIYYERYGKVLQAEGYLTESQRHGKAGYSLTKLLARLRNSIRLIDRPHGQHAVILTEDIPTFIENRNEKNDPGPIINGSRQIYLTFPADSTFSEDDVSNYFETFGPVEDVRIPCQQKRMFGFVTFVSADTVKVILAKGNPHYVCGARVLVKPYREKSKFIDRKYQDRIETSLYYTPHYTNMDSELNSTLRSFESSWLSRRQLMEEQEQLLKSERNRLPGGLNLVCKLAPNSGYSMDGLNISRANFDSWPSEQYNHLLDVLHSSPIRDDKPTNTTSNYTELESNPGFDLPESPFAPSVASGISTTVL